MKVLHVTYRFGERIIGGAEKYLWNLSTRLAKSGADITIATTQAGQFREPTRFNVFWDEGYPQKEEFCSCLRILRFPFRNLPKWLAALYAIPLQRRFDSEEWTFDPHRIMPANGGILGRGWYFEEQIGTTTQRWMGQKAEIFIQDENVWEIGFSGQCPWKNSGEVFANGRKIGEFSPDRNTRYYSFKLPEPGNNVTIEIQLKRTTRPWKDLRQLGMLMFDVTYQTGKRTEKIPLHRHYSSELHTQSDSLLDWYEKRAYARPDKYCRWFDLCRGPVSPALVRFLKTHAGDYDLILGHNLPFFTLRQAVVSGEKAGVATAALPLAHLEDDYYHWKHYYDALARADICFALSDYSRDIFRNRFHSNAHTLGGGVDLQEFQNTLIDGRRFRKEYNLGDMPLVLFVGRKSYPKRYDALIRAVRIVNKTRPCKLVMIGPDENRQPVDPRDALYLGEKPRGTVLDAYDACDVFAMLSGSESFGMVFTEAWMRAKPVIGYKHCGAVASLIDDGENGFLCDREEDAAQRILRILDDPSLSRLLGEAGRRKTLASYTWDIISEKAGRHYEDAIGRKKRQSTI